MSRPRHLLQLFVSLFLLSQTLSACARSGSGTLIRSDRKASRAASTRATSSVAWLEYFAALGTVSESRDRLMMLYFTRDSCVPCAMMERWTLTDRRVVKSLKDVVPVKINGSVDHQVVRRYDVQTFPMIIFVRLDQGEIDKKAGYRDPDFMLEWIRNVKANRMTIKSLSERLEQESDNLDLLLKQAHNFVDADQTDLAFELARKSAEIAPGNAEVLALFGLCRVRQGDLEEAENDLAAALAADPDNEEARGLMKLLLLKKANALLQEKEPEEAMSLFSEVLEADAESFEARMGMGRACMEAGLEDRSLTEFLRAARIRPDSPVPIAAIGDIYMRQEQFAKAETWLLQAIKVEPRYEPPYFRLMELYEKIGKQHELMEMWEKILPLEPAGAHNQLAWLMATSTHPRIFNPEAAVQHALAAVEHEPHPWYIDTLAEAYYAQGNYDLAIAIISEAIAKEPEDLQYYEEQLRKFKEAKNRHERADKETQR